METGRAMLAWEVEEGEEGSIVRALNRNVGQAGNCGVVAAPGSLRAEDVVARAGTGAVGCRIVRVACAVRRMLVSA